MSTDPARRWGDDSPEEDFEASRAAELDRLARWGREQKLRPLTDQLDAHGLTREPRETLAESVILPDWWEDIAAPANPCPWCQRPVPASPCPQCRTARAADVDPPAAWAWWAGLAAQARRLHIAASYGVDPWSGRYCSIRQESTELDQEGQVCTSYLLYFGAAPKGIYWGARLQLGLPWALDGSALIAADLYRASP
jgi:hypothetical protein